MGKNVLLGPVVKIGGMGESSVGRGGIAPTQTGGAVIARDKAGDLVSMATFPSIRSPKLSLVIRYGRSASDTPSGQKTLTLSLL